MAVEWIPIRVDTLSRPQILRIAVETKMPKHEVAGRVLHLWLWACQHTADGNLPGVSIDQLIIEIGADEQFWNAVARAGWLEIREDGLVIPEFVKYLGRSGKARLMDTANKVAKRDAVKSVRQLSGSQPDKSRTTAGRQLQLHRQEQIQEENKTPLPPSRGNRRASPKPQIEIPASLAVEPFLSSWGRWVQHRIEIKKPLTPSNANSLLAKLEKFGAEWSVSRIDLAISNGWRGLIFPDDLNPNLFAGAPPPNGRDVDREVQMANDAIREMDERDARRNA